MQRLKPKTPMKKLSIVVLLAALCLSGCVSNELSSPNTKISLSVDAESQASFSIFYGDELIVDNAALGYITASNDWSGEVKLVAASKPKQITDDYQMLIGKRLHCVNQATERTYTFQNEAKAKMDVTFRAYNDGVAFRYTLHSKGEDMVFSEQTVYPVADGLKRWMQSYDPGYEAFYPLTEDGSANNNSFGGFGRPRKPKHNYGYPALVELNESLFMLLTEANIERNHPASWIDNENNQEQYKVVLASDSLAFNDTWVSPWRVMMIGQLSDIVESTLVTDVSEPAKVDASSWVNPAPASWVYWAYNHGSNDYQIVKEYIDLAAEMKWPYTLIDAEWDVMSNGGNLDDAIAYALSKGVKPFVWYNSGTNWAGPNSGAPTPWYRLNKPEDREKEFTSLKEKGVAGVKIDFFVGDDVETMNYYIDLSEDALKHELMINFHGATIPRGWQRTYPNLMSVEAVYGAEWYNNGPRLTNRAAQHNAVLPYTRNVIGPMDYTPGTFSDSQNPHITSHGHELALYVAFESGIQHMPDRPSTYRELPSEVKEVLSSLPTAWDDTKLLAGYPGESVVIARKKGDVWYVAGINGKDEPAKLNFSLDRLDGCGTQVNLFADGSDNRSFAISQKAAVDFTSVDCLERGGFLAVIK